MRFRIVRFLNPSALGAHTWSEIRDYNAYVLQYNSHSRRMKFLSRLVRGLCTLSRSEFPSRRVSRWVSGGNRRGWNGARHALARVGSASLPLRGYGTGPGSALYIYIYTYVSTYVWAGTCLHTYLALSVVSNDACNSRS